MKISYIFIILLFFAKCVNSQELHSESNAVSRTNESNNTTGWYGGATLSTDASDVHDGSFSLRATTSSGNQRDLRYSFNAVVGEEYVIVLWAKEGSQSFRPAFANWQGVSGFSTTRIIGQNWNEYSFTVTATTSSPEIRIYTNPSQNSTIGDHIFIDFVSISSTSVSDDENPSPISDLNSNNLTETSLTLFWSEPSDNVGVTNYEVFQGISSLGFTNGATQFNVTNLDPNTNYSFIVVAIDQAGNRSSSSNTENITTLSDTQPPSTIVDLAASDTTPNSTLLTWSISNDNVQVTDYEVFEGGQSLGFTDGDNQFNVSNLDPNTNYSFTVFARDAVPNISSVSNTLNLTTPSIPDNQDPNIPTNLQANNIEAFTTDLSWTASTDNDVVSNYEIFQDGLSIGFSGGGLTFQVQSLISCETYIFAVRAIDPTGNTSALSQGVEITTPTAFDPGADPTPPAIAEEITNISFSNLNTTSVDINWTYNAQDNDRVLDYEIFQDNLSIGLTGGAISFSVTGLNIDTDYAFRVEPILCSGRATNGGTVINVRTLTTPSVLNYDANNANLPNIDWETRDLFANGNVGIGTQNTQGFRLAVAGSIVAEEIKVALQNNWPDFVFENDYELPSLKEVEDYINKHGHLKNIPSANEIEKTGIILGSLNAKLLEKIEELVLYTIDQDKKIKRLEEENKKTQILLKELIESKNEQ